MIPEPVRAYLLENGFGAPGKTTPVGGGCISNGMRLRTASGQMFFLKTNARCPEDMFAREAEGLAALHTPDGPRVPQPHLHGPHFLLLEDLAPASRSRAYWPALGRQLAAMHNHTAPQFGFPHDNYIGSTPQPNAHTADGFKFFAEYRLNYQAELANRRGLLTQRETTQVARFAALLPSLVPRQPASLLHGDLWSGNMIADARGQPAIIDPAAHYGWAEADLAMTALFGSPPAVFYQAYQETRPLPPGLRTRFPLYNLYHLLNHLNLFGRGYYGQVTSILRQYGDKK